MKRQSTQAPPPVAVPSSSRHKSKKNNKGKIRTHKGKHNATQKDETNDATELQGTSWYQDCERDMQQLRYYHTLLKADEFDFFFDVIQTWTLCLKVVTLDEDACMAMTGGFGISREDRWGKLKGFMRNVQHDDTSTRKMWTMFASELQKLLTEEGARAILNKAERLPGLSYSTP